MLIVYIWVAWNFQVVCGFNFALSIGCVLADKYVICVVEQHKLQVIALITYSWTFLVLTVFQAFGVDGEPLVYAYS